MGGDDPNPAAPGATPGVAEEGVDPDSLKDQWGEILTGLETRQQEELRETALTEIREEFPTYLELINTHPRMLVGKELPGLSGEDDDVDIPRDEADAKSWQEAVSQLLNKDIQDRVSRKTEAVKPMMEALHSSVQMFQNNPDLIVGTKGFDKELANTFAELAQDYALKVDDKIVGSGLGFVK